MPAPTNTTPGTAIDITTLPYSNTQVVDFGGVTSTVWYKYTFDVDKVIGIFGFGSGGVYTTRIDVYGPNSSVIHSDIASTINRPIQLQGNAGDQYFIKLAPVAGNPTPANLAITAYEAPTDAIVAGDIMVNDDTPGFPAIILNGTTLAPRRFEFPIGAGEFGDSLITGVPVYAVQDINLFKVAVYDENFDLISAFTPLGSDDDPYIRSNKVLDLIYVLAPNATLNWILQSIDHTGTVSGALVTTGILANGNLIKAFSVNNDATIIYLGGNGATWGALRQWNIAGAALGADIAASIANNQITDVLVLTDGTIVAMYVNTGTLDVNVRRYSAAGALLNTYALGTSFHSSGFDHICHAEDDPTHFWAWTHGTGADQGKSRFRKINVSTGVADIDVTIPEYETGAYQSAIANPPLADFGPSFSCPFFLVAPLVATPGTITVTKVTFPIGNTQQFAFTAAGGLAPTSFNLGNGESRTYDPVPVGSGYSIVETEDASFDTEYTVSNGSPHTNITVADGEAVTVTVTNTLKSAIGSGIYKIVPGDNKRNDTLWNANTSGTTDVKIPNIFGTTGFIGD